MLLHGKKLAGILLERSGDRVAVGFGVNLAQRPELAGSARRIALGGKISPQAFAPLLAASFARLLDLWRQSDAASARPGVAGARASRRHAAHASIRAATRSSRGRFDGLEPDGALRLRRDDGTLDIVHAGDVEL